MGFELMNLLQSTVFKSMTKTTNFIGLWLKVFRFDCVQTSFGTGAIGQKQTLVNAHVFQKPTAIPSKKYPDMPTLEGNT